MRLPSLRGLRLSLLPVLALSAIAISTAISVGCSNSSEDTGMSEDRVTDDGYGYGYDGYGYYGYGYGYDGYGYGY